MATYLGGQPVNLTISLLDENGTLIPAMAAEYRLVDQDENELVAKVAVPDFFEGAEEVVIAVTAEHNALTAPNLREIRIVELYLTTAAGVVKVDSHYTIEAEQPLVEGVNSFQSYNTALMTAGDIVSIPAWNNATKQERVIALIEARRNIGQLAFRYGFDEQNQLEDSLGVNDITGLSQSEFAALPVTFRMALRRAQILEADFLLGGDEIDVLRKGGLISTTVGEAKQFFRPAKPLEQAICKRAMKELTKWLLNRTRIART